MHGTRTTRSALLRGDRASGKVFLWCVDDILASAPSLCSGIRSRALPEENRYEVVYAVVRAGGRQEKVEVGTIVVLDRQSAKIGENIELPAVLLVDGDAVTTDADKLASVTVTAEVLGEERGPKIVIQKFKNKTGYKKRQGHRQDLTRVKVTGIK